MNASLNQNSKPVPNERPNSSRFPPLVRQSPEQHFRRRSSSSDYSFNDTKLDFKSNENKSSNYPTNDYKQNGTYDEYLLKQESSGASKEMTLALPRSSINECKRLKRENQVLKNNFLRMSRHIQKHSRLMAKKDDIILRLQETNHRNYLPLIEPNISRRQNELDSLSLYHSMQTPEEIESKNSEFSQKFRQIYDSMITDFNQHLSQFMKVIEEMHIFLENNLKVIERRNSDNYVENKNELDAKLHALNADYYELQNNYEVLIRQNMDFKSFIEFVVNSFNDNYVKDLTSNASIDSLRQHFTDLLSKNQTLNEEIILIQRSRKLEEEYCFWLIECLSEMELELELTGRSPKTLSELIEKFDQKLDSIRQTLSQTYLQSLTKTLLQIYRNHLKWFQFVNKPSKSTQTWILSRVEDSSTEEEEEMGSDGKQMICTEISDDFKYQEKRCEMNEISDEIKSKFDEMSDEMPFDDFDIETINYILMAKHFDYNLKSNLEVVEEVEEENIDEEEEESDLSYEDNVFEEVEECSDNSPKDNETNNVKNDCKNQNIDLEVKQVLNDILDEIDNKFSAKIEESYQGQPMQQTSTNSSDIDLNRIGVLYSPSTSSCSLVNYPNECHFDDTKPQNIDSDFVSDDLSSSPETVMNLNQDSLGKPVQSLTDVQGHTFDQLKQLKSRHSSEVESITSEDKNSDNNQKQQSKENQYLSDELRAWKEMVEQQRAIMEKIRNELEQQQRLNTEKDKTIESLKSQSKSESLAEISENQTLVHQNSDKSVDVSDDECKTLMDELELNNLFNDNSDESDDNDLEVIEVNHCLTEGNDICESSHKKSPDIMIQEVWTKGDDLLERNYVSDESSGYSVYTDHSSPLSAPDELLTTTNRRKVFIPFSHEDAAVRRHSCQGRLIRYGNHPRKKKLELKSVEIVFQKEKVGKETRKSKVINKN